MLTLPLSEPVAPHALMAPARRVMMQQQVSNTHLSNFPLFIKKGNLLADLSLLYFLTT